MAVELRKDAIKIDKEAMRTDRSTPLGKAFDKKAEEAANQKNPQMANFMSQVLAYTEAATVIDETVADPQKKDQMLGRLKNKMESM